MKPQKKPTKRELWLLGQEVGKALPPTASLLRPSRAAIKEAAAKMGISQALARRALDHFNFE